jgi:hypothetical protein
MSGSSERRKCSRFKVTEGAFAFINNTPFTIRNISEGGMQLHSVLFDDSPLDEMLVDIFLKKDNFYLQNIPVHLVRIKKNSAASSFSGLHDKCFGLQFGELTQQQKTRLDYFIAHGTTGEA